MNNVNQLEKYANWQVDRRCWNKRRRAIYRR